jgi:hypothetical protein
MPIRKSRLTRTELTKCRAAAQELQRAGRIPKIPSEWVEDARALDIVVGSAPASLCFDLPSGAVGYSIEIRLVARQPGVILLDCQIATEWDTEIFLPTSDARTPLRKLGWLEYSRSELLNDWTETPLRFHSRGQMFEGMILAMGFKPIPSAYRHGMLAPFEVTFLDQHENEIRQEAKLIVERTSKQKSMVVRRRTGLYDRRETPESSVAVVHTDQSVGCAAPSVGQSQALIGAEEAEAELRSRCRFP